MQFNSIFHILPVSETNIIVYIKNNFNLHFQNNKQLVDCGEYLFRKANFIDYLTQQCHEMELETEF